MTKTTNTDPHACFHPGARRHAGRIHLPVAARSNARLRWGAPAPSQALAPAEALERLWAVLESGVDIKVVGVTGPGDPLADPGPTMMALQKIHDELPDMILCLGTNGLGVAGPGGAGLARELADVGLDHVTVFLDAVDPEILERLYVWIRPGTHTLPMAEAAKVMAQAQTEAISAFIRAGLTVKVNATVYPGINAEHLPEVARTVARLGVDLMALAPYRPTGQPSDDQDEPQAPTQDLMDAVRGLCGEHLRVLPQLGHCGRDLVGTVDDPDANQAFMAPKAPKLPVPSPSRPNLAVATASGMEVDLHLGHAVRIMVYGPRAEDGLVGLLEARQAPEPGGGVQRWKDLAATLSDCFALLAVSAGERPRGVLAELDLPVLITEGEVEGAVDLFFDGKKRGGGKKKRGNTNR